MQKWFTNVGDLAKTLKVSRPTLNKYRALDGFPGKTSRGYYAPKCRTFLKDQEAKRVAAAAAPANARNEHKDRKTQLECQRLELTIAELEGRIVTKAEARDMLIEYAGSVNLVFARFLEEVKAGIRNPAILKKATAMVKDSKRRLAARIRELDAEARSASDAK